MDKIKQPKTYPLSENYAVSITGKNGFLLADLTMENIVNDKVKMEDIQISAETLLSQSAVSANAGRQALANNFKRASEMVSIPADFLEEAASIYKEHGIFKKRF